MAHRHHRIRYSSRESLSFTILDCFDGMVPYWTIGETPDASLVNGMLDQAIFGLGEGEHPLSHYVNTRQNGSYCLKYK